MTAQQLSRAGSLGAGAWQRRLAWMPPRASPCGTSSADPGPAVNVPEWVEIHSDGELDEVEVVEPNLPPENINPDESLGALRERLQRQLGNLASAVNHVGAAEVSGSSRVSSGQEPAQLRSERASVGLTRAEHYEEALGQAMELYEQIHSGENPKSIWAAAHRAARQNTYAEALRMQREIDPEMWPEGWNDIMQDAMAAWAQDSGATLQVDAEVRSLPEVRSTRARTSARSSTSPEETPTRSRVRTREEIPVTLEQTSQATPDPTVPGSVTDQLNRWQQLMLRVQARKRWSDKGRLCNYAKNGIPRNIDGKPTGFGRHLGRWGWREISFEW